MRLRAWRLARWAFAAEAFTGEGSRLHGGRWNSPGSPVIYAGDSQALCALETIVHFQPNRLPSVYAFFALDIPSTLIQALAFELPPNWATMSLVTAQIGDEWLRAPDATAVLEVPSALVPEGRNYLINPQHPQFGEIIRGKPVPFSFDPRIDPLKPKA